MATKKGKQQGRQPSRPLAGTVDTAKSVLDRANNVAGEVVDNVADLTEPVRDIAASVVGVLSPTAARALHPEGQKKNTAPKQPARKRVSQSAKKTTAAASRTAGQTRKAASGAVKSANRAVDRAQSAASRAVKPSGGKKKKR